MHTYVLFIDNEIDILGLFPQLISEVNPTGSHANKDDFYFSLCAHGLFLNHTRCHPIADSCLNRHSKSVFEVCVPRYCNVVAKWGWYWQWQPRADKLSPLLDLSSVQSTAISAGRLSLKARMRQQRVWNKLYLWRQTLANIANPSQRSYPSWLIHFGFVQSILWQCGAGWGALIRTCGGV